MPAREPQSPLESAHRETEGSFWYSSLSCVDLLRFPHWRFASQLPAASGPLSSGSLLCELLVSARLPVGFAYSRGGSRNGIGPTNVFAIAVFMRCGTSPSIVAGARPRRI